jgi:meso-butanediol dehydrogenase / (S,S)-butanediol dehydrogenase / diacetyl reductase
MISFNRKVGVVTGSGSGIGRATAIGFARAGGSVVVADINIEAAQATVNDIKAQGGTASACKTDMTRAEDIQTMFEFTLQQFGRLDFLHNNAYGIPPSLYTEVGPVGSSSDEAWEYGLNMGLTSYFRAMRAAIPIFLKQGAGVIVNTGSVSGLRGEYGVGVYCAVKAAVINLTRQAAIEYAGKNIRVNCVCPGTIATPPMLAGMKHFKLENVYPEAIPMGRIGKPEELANAVLFLASDLASYITGEILTVDGGLLAKTGLPNFLQIGK